MCFLVLEADDRQRVHRCELMLLGDERLGRSVQPGEEQPALVGHVPHEVAGEAEDIGATLGCVEEHARFTSGPTSCMPNSNEVTIPKLPPPPRNPQSSSWFSVSTPAGSCRLR